ncbi:Olfactory receptor 2T11 [Heterocephalus glaber]|uniref:Olfactory receptor 2T11 n=1 Tax=Heterocephalus glaber TaxID=10181 RepID=G5B078_HETGA|nr:Olfactory receptor 2T11 [Heterocephalus glaber]
MDCVYICITVPKLLQGLLSEQRTISFLGCVLQIFLYLTLIQSEFFLLDLMDYDCYVAMYSPLHYPVPMSHRVCLCMALCSWLSGSLDGFMLTPVTISFPYCASVLSSDELEGVPAAGCCGLVWGLSGWLSAHAITMNVPYCGSHSINHFFYEIPVVLELPCSDTSLYDTLMYIFCVLMLLIPISIIFTSYSLISLTICHVHSTEGCKKAFNTCSSHLIFVTIFYMAAFYTYVQPHSFHMPEQDKVISVFFTIVTPMLNPHIYSLRNKDIMGGSRRIVTCCS